MDDRARSRRRLALVLIAVIAPSAAILGLGVRLMLQENTLAESRRVDSFEEALDDYADAFDAVRFQAPDSLVVFRAPVAEGRLSLPWMEARPIPLTGRFGSLIREGENTEYTRNAPRAASRQYARALEAAGTPRQEALALLNVTRAASRAGLAADSDSARARLSNYPPDVTDEFGVPMSLFGVYTEPDKARKLAILASPCRE